MTRSVAAGWLYLEVVGSLCSLSLCLNIDISSRYIMSISTIEYIVSDKPRSFIVIVSSTILETLTISSLHYRVHM